MSDGGPPTDARTSDRPLGEQAARVAAYFAANPDARLESNRRIARQIAVDEWSVRAWKAANGVPALKRWNRHGVPADPDQPPSGMAAGRAKPPRPTAAELAAVITRLRTAAGLSVPALAARAGLSARMLARYEGGLYTPGFDGVILLARALGLTADDFVPAKWKRRKGKKKEG